MVRLYVGRHYVDTGLARNHVHFKGTVVHVRHYGGYYLIVSDSGRNYYPINLPRKFGKGGLRIWLDGTTRGYTVDGRTPRLDIYEIRAL